MTKPAFTLVEVLVAIAISSLLMMAASIILINFSELYISEQTRPAYEQHAGNVTRFLEQTFYAAQANSNSANNNNNQNNQNNQNNIKWSVLPGNVFGDDEYLSFKFDRELPILYWKEGVLPSVTMFLYMKPGSGLFFLWQTDNQAQTDPDDLQETLISPFVKAIHYQKYNVQDEAWEENDEFLGDSTANQPSPIPDMIRLEFSWEDEKSIETTLILPPEITNAPVY